MLFIVDVASQSKQELLLYLRFKFNCAKFRIIDSRTLDEFNIEFSRKSPEIVYLNLTLLQLLAHLVVSFSVKSAPEIGS